MDTPATSDTSLSNRYIQQNKQEAEWVKQEAMEREKSRRLRLDEERSHTNPGKRVKTISPTGSTPRQVHEF